MNLFKVVYSKTDCVHVGGDINYDTQWVTTNGESYIMALSYKEVAHCIELSNPTWMVTSISDLGNLDYPNMYQITRKSNY